VLSHGMTIEALCPTCGKANEFETEDRSFMLSCHSCSNPFGFISDFVSQKGELNHCGICGCRDLYIQKDFSRVVGCSIAAIGAILAPFTRFLSLLVAALIDLVLYKVLPLITICYRCKSIYRDFPLNPAHEAFNLGINDRYRSA